MKDLQRTKTGSLFNWIGILNHAGDYAGKYQDEAIDIIQDLEPDEPYIIETLFWADIMVNVETKKVYAVWADEELTSKSGDVLYTEIEKPDCPAAYVAAMALINN